MIYDPKPDEPVTSTEEFYSFHTFLFPFKWRNEGSGDLLLEQQNALASLKGAFSDSLKWKHQPINRPETVLQYNEKNYFYNFVWDSIYDNGNPDSILHHLQYQFNDRGKYFIHCRGREFELEIDEIYLHLYNTGVGVMSFFLYNRKREQSSPNDILLINQYGRRLFPPFYPTLLKGHGTAAFDSDSDFERALRTAKQFSIEIGDRILIMDGSERICETDYSHNDSSPQPAPMPSMIQELLPTSLIDSGFRFLPVTDDRMFVVCWYGNAELAKLITGKKQIASYEFDSKSGRISTSKPYPNYLESDWWYRYIFVDGMERSCQDDDLVSDLVKNASNTRWSNYNTMFGVGRYSFVMLTSEYSKLGNATFLIGHIQSMYYKMVELCLLQRASVLRFSEEVTGLSANLEKVDALHPKVASLYSQYIRFVNKIYFREVTAQEQGIELYDLLQKQMRIEQHVKDLDGEINELHQWLSIAQEKRRNDTLERLSIMGALFIVPSFIVGFLGMNVIDRIEMKWVPFVIGLFLILSYSIFKGIGQGPARRWFWLMAVLSGLSVLLLLMYNFKI